MIRKKNNERQWRLGQFEGPLHLLLFLIKKNEMNIHDIPISEITEQYLDVLKYAVGIDLEEITDFYLMAATLLHIKSRLLLPVEIDIEDDIEDPREGLVLQLIEYERYRKLADIMAERGEDNEWIVERRKTQAVLPFPEEPEQWEPVSAWDLFKCFSKVMKGLGNEQILSLWEESSINEKTTLIREYLERKKEFSFDDLIINPGSLMEVICSFFAVLEMVKGGNIDVYQNRLFGDIRIRPRDQ